MKPPFYETRMQNKIVSDEELPGIWWRTMTRPFLHSVLANAARREGVEIVTNSTVAGATFTCAVDKLLAAPCASPFKQNSNTASTRSS